MLTRRRFLVTSSIVTVGLAAPRVGRAGGVVEIRMKSDPGGVDVWFDPVGVLITPGQTVRWINAENVHTTTAYHPKNDMHSLRIPDGATPWDSGYLRNPGDHFEIVLATEGVYDYYCTPHEEAGMVGRIVVGKPSGPGTLPFDYFRRKPGAEHWKPVPVSAQRVFPRVALIMAHGVVRREATARRSR